MAGARVGTLVGVAMTTCVITLAIAGAYTRKIEQRLSARINTLEADHEVDHWASHVHAVVHVEGSGCDFRKPEGAVEPRALVQRVGEGQCQTNFWIDPAKGASCPAHWNVTVGKQTTVLPNEMSATMDGSRFVLATFPCPNLLEASGLKFIPRD